MTMIPVILERAQPNPNAFRAFSNDTMSSGRADESKANFLQDLSDFDITYNSATPPVPLFDTSSGLDELVSLSSHSKNFSQPPSADVDFASQSVALAATINESDVQKLEERGIKVWPDEAMGLMQTGTDCRPFEPAVNVARIRRELGVSVAFNAGYTGDDVVVAIVDEGVNDYYPIIGGSSSPNTPKPGSAPITSHGSMCAADVGIAAPGAKLLDYPLINPRTSNQLAVLQEILTEKKTSGRPHIANNSYGFYALSTDPRHPGRDPNHPFNRKILELVRAGIICFFAAGNCGPDCPSGNCDSSATGPNRSINGANSMAEVITIAAVNANRVRIGYSSVGPGLLDPQKPDLAAYSHFYGNFGPGRPAGGTAGDFDNGTSAASPVAAGVAALLLSKQPDISPAAMKQLLIDGAIDAPTGNFDHLVGHGTIHAGNSFGLL